MQVYAWREDFRVRFEWTSVVGFTLGILVSLGSLLQVRTVAICNNTHSDTTAIGYLSFPGADPSLFGLSSLLQALRLRSPVYRRARVDETRLRHALAL